MNTVCKNKKANHVLVASMAVGFLFSLGAHPAMAKNAAAPSSQQSEADIRLALEQVTLAANTGNMDEALRLLAKLEAAHPNDPQVRAAAADLYAQVENRGLAFAALSQAGASPSVAEHQREILLSPNGAFVSGGYNYRGTKEANESMMKFSGQTDVASGLAFSANFEDDHIDTTVPFLRQNGTLQSFYGDRQVGAVSLDKLFSDGQEVVGSLYAVADNAGAGGLYRLWDEWGSTSVAFDYNRPEMDYVEAAVEHGTASGFTVERKQHFNEYVQARIDGKYLQYSLDNAPDAAEAPGWDFDLDFAHDLFASSFANSGDNAPVFGAHYNVNAEYFSHIQKTTSMAGNPFTPLPVASYELHTFTISLAKDFLPELKGEVSGGYGVNRIAGNTGPIYGFLLNYNPTKQLGVAFHASRTLLGGQNDGEKENNIGADLKWSW